MGNLDNEDEFEDVENQYYAQEVTPETTEGWTTDPSESVEEAEVYMPPTDPPVLPSSNQGADIATGTGTSAEGAPFRADAPAGDAWIQEEVTRVLQEDSLTSELPLSVNVANGTVFIHGFVRDAEDAEQAESVAGLVPGVVSVEDRTVVDAARVEATSMDFISPDVEP